MLKKSILLVALTTIFVGCASVPTTDQTLSIQAKQFTPPAEGKAGVYIYRNNSSVGGGLKKDIWLDGNCVGESARGIFFYETVEGNKEHTVSTESEFSPNHLTLNTESGKNYFVQQYIKVGVFVGGANLKQVDEQAGKLALEKLSLAKSGNCSKPFKK